MADQNSDSNRVTLPTAEEMEAAVESLPPVLSKTLETSAKPTTTKTPVPSSIKLANTPENDLDFTPTTNTSWSDLRKKAIRYFPKILGIGLTLQSLRGIYNSVAFILVDYPILEQKLVAHQITETEVSRLVVMMIILLISTLVSLFFAMRLTFVAEATAKRVSTVIGLLLFFGNPFLGKFLEATHVTNWVVSFFTQSVQTIYEAPGQVIENTPFLEQNGEELNTVWYK